MKSAAEVTRAKGESQVCAPNLDQKFDQKHKSSLGSVGGVPAGGVVVVADVVKVAKRAGGSIVLVKVEVGHLDEENQHLDHLFLSASFL